MSLDLLITDAIVVNAGGSIRSHVGVTNGAISYLPGTTTGQVPDSRRAIAAQGRVLIPGGVDGHCHVAQVTGAYKSLDTFRTATTAALHGGTTTIIDFGIPAGLAESPLTAVQSKMRQIEGARCDVALHGSVISWDDSVPAQLEWMAANGIRSVKLYTTNRGTTMADEDTILKVMKEMVRLDGLTYIHAEHDAIIVDRTDACAADGHVTVSDLHRTRPALSEEASVREMLAIAEYTGAVVYFVHQTTPQAVDAVVEARSRGLVVYSETCPHYLCFDESVYTSQVPERFACCPPMRPTDAMKGLVDRVVDGSVDVIASDHSCYDLTQKRSSTHDVRQMPHGLPGVETRMAASLTALVKEQGMPLEHFVEVFSAGPARINGLDTKGQVALGFDADLVLFDPGEARTVDERALHMGTDFSPFDQRELVGWPSTVIFGGRVVVDHGVFLDPGPVGKFRRRHGPQSQDQKLEKVSTP